MGRRVKQLKFLVHCIDVTESLLIKPDKEEMDLMLTSRKHDELQDDKYDSMMN